MSEEVPLPVAVIGCGRMGKLHARVYSQVPSTRLIGVYDVNPAVAAAVAAEYKTRAVDSIDDLLKEARAVSIAVPTRDHLTIAEPFLKRGIACLIEKPLAKDSREARRIAELARAHNAMVQVGHIERFNPAVRALRNLNIRPRFMEVVRVSPMPFRSIDVGVVLDVMIHDIDIVLSLADSPVAKVDAVGVCVIGGGVEDICNARVTFESGCVANLTASRLAMKTERRMRIFSREAFVSLDYQKKQAVMVRRAGNLDALRGTIDKLRKGEIKDPSQLNFQSLVNIEPLPVEDVDQIRAEVESFVQAVRTGSPPVVSAEAGLAAVELAEKIMAAIAPNMNL